MFLSTNREETYELRVDLGWPDTQHREQHAALVGIVRVRGHDALRLVGSLVGQRLEVVDRGWFGLGWHSPSLGDAVPGAHMRNAHITLRGCYLPAVDPV